MSYIKALINNLPQNTENNSDTSDTDSDIEDISKTNKSNKNDKFKALLKAQKQLINKCLPSEDFDKIIKKNLGKSKWKGVTITMSIKNDQIKINYNKNEYIFSKERFLNNKVFKYNLIKSFNEKYDNKLWIKVYKDNNDYKLFINNNKHLLNS